MASQYPAKLLQFFADVERAWVSMRGFPHQGKMCGFYDPDAASGTHSDSGPFNPEFLADLRTRRGPRLQAFNAYRKSLDPNVNNNGQAVGTTGLCSNTSLPPVNPAGVHAVLWDRDGSPTDLGSLGGTFNGASSINNRGEVVGVAISPKDGTIHAFLWTRATGMQDFGAFPACNTQSKVAEIGPTSKIAEKP